MKSRKFNNFLKIFNLNLKLNQIFNNQLADISITSNQSIKPS